MDVVAEYKASRDYMRTGMCEVFGDDFVGKINLLLSEAAVDTIDRMHGTDKEGSYVLRIRVSSFRNFKIFSDGNGSVLHSTGCVCDSLLPEFDGILSDPSKQDAFLRLLISELVK